MRIGADGRAGAGAVGNLAASRARVAGSARGRAMTLTFPLLLASAALIYLACEFFINGVEWVGARWGVSQTAVGTVLAAFGTALPESVVTLVAVVFGKTAARRDIGVGAALGGPLALSTLAYAVVGLVFLLERGRLRPITGEFSTRRLVHDQLWFLVVFGFKVGLGLVAFAWKPWLGGLFLLAYGLYVWRELRAPSESGGAIGSAAAAGPAADEREPLKLRPHTAQPSTGWALVQTGGALVVIFLSSQLFVHQLDLVGPWLGLGPQRVALLLSPIATELPEILNAVVWVRQGKTALALGNISGAMMIQATVPSALGLFFTPWLLEPTLVWAAAVTMAAIVVMLVLLWRRALGARALLALSALYGVFAAGVVALSR